MGSDPSGSRSTTALSDPTESRRLVFMAMKDLVIRIGGEAGEGVLSTGQLLAQAAARGGYKVITYFSPPAEIKGGHSFFQIRLSGAAPFNEGDVLDILL